MKILISLLLIVTFFSCDRNTSSQDSKANINTSIKNDTTIQQGETIPNSLLEFINDQLPNYRIPEQSEYANIYSEKIENSQYPYFTEGAFNQDSLTDYALLLLSEVQGGFEISVFVFVTKQNNDYDYFKCYTEKQKKEFRLADELSFVNAAYSQHTQEQLNTDGDALLYIGWRSLGDIQAHFWLKQSELRMEFAEEYTD
ncbi:hypothetical protein [Algivirga pacifica]|uniref:Uncharacterized protein n=1 Tax=Algivirga pacifica TaxID=1162670 RepID=A0ABP9DLS5_9BACT